MPASIYLLVGVQGEYLVENRGTGHYRFRNWIRCNLDATSAADSINSGCSVTSYAYTSKPSFLGSYPWPAIGLSNIFVRNGILPARDRYYSIVGSGMDTVTYFTCPIVKSNIPEAIRYANVKIAYDNVNQRK